MIERVTSPEGWNRAVLEGGGGFLQSWQWGEFQRSLGREPLRLRGERGLAQLVRLPLPFGLSYWYAPRGPVGELPLERDPDVARGVFVRMEPQAVPSRPAVKVDDVQPGQTLVVDLTQPEEAILAAMHEKWRYNARLAERKGVRVFMAGRDDASALDVFWDLLQETTERDGFRAHGKGHYRGILDALSGDPATDAAERPVARLVFAEHDGRVLAANFMVYFGGTATYLHGASSRTRRDVMAPQLLHWTAMREAKAWGFREYDFWGVAPEGSEGHSWAGITRFKRGFGGRYVAYPGTFDLPTDRFRYTLYALAKRLLS